MKLFNPDFTVYFLFLLVLTLLTFVTGGIISYFIYKEGSKYFRVFINLLLGYLFWIIITAIYFTHGDTVLILIPISILFWVLIFGKDKRIRRNEFKLIIKDSLVLLKESWFLLFIFVLFAVKHIIANGVIESDYLDYANVAYSLKLSGLEGTNFGMFTSYFVNPYHYSDLWLIAFITEIFKTNYYHSTIFISVPFLLFMVYSGSIALIKELGIRMFNNFKIKNAFLYATIIIVLVGLDFPVIRNYMAGTTGLIQMPKLSIIYIIYILSIILLLRKQNKYAFFAILLLTSLYSQTIFFILPAVGLLILFEIFKNRNEGLKYLLFYISVVIMFLIFYYVNSRIYNDITPISYSKDKIFEGIASFPVQLIKKTIRFSIVYSPFLILFFLLYPAKNLNLWLNNLKKSNIFLILAGFLIFGFLFSLLFSRTLSIVEQDFAQILTNSLYPLLAIYSFIILMLSLNTLVIKNEHKYLSLKILILSVVLMGVILQYHRDPRYWGYLEKISVDKEFYLKIDSALIDNDKIATFQNFETPSKDTIWFQYNYQLYPNLRRIANFKNNGIYYPECINVCELDTLDSEARKYFYKKSPFIHFFNSLKDKKTEITAGMAQYLFLKKHKFSYVILPNNHKTPDEIKPLIIDSIVRKDRLRLYKLNTLDR